MVFGLFGARECLVFLLWIVNGKRGSVKLGVCLWTIVRGVQLLRERRGIFLRFQLIFERAYRCWAMFCFGPYQTVLSNLAKLDLDPARGAQNRSRTHWVEEDESSYSYFFCLVKKQSADRIVSALRLPDGTIFNCAQDLVDCFAGFFFSLFSAEEIDRSARRELLSECLCAVFC